MLTPDFANRQERRRSALSLKIKTEKELRMKTNLVEAPITANEVKEQDRLTMLPRYFGAFMITVEQMVYNCLSDISPDYHGGLWKFYVLDNQGFYMAPEIEGKLRISVAGNYFEGELSPDAAGIVACLFAYSRVSFVPTASHIGQQYRLLYEYALEHPEVESILAAID